MREEKKQWLDSYFSRYSEAFERRTYELLDILSQKILQIKESNNKIILAGNGASSAIASHLALDFTKQGKVKAITFSDASLITAFANDYNYDNWLAKAVEAYSEQGDMLILISASGESNNILSAAKLANKNGVELITFTGHKSNNSLRSLGRLNFWYDSMAYNVVECVHMIWLTTVVDMVIGKAEYRVS